MTDEHPVEHADDIARLVAELDTDGCLTDPAWKAAFRSVPRHVFLPRFFTALPDGRWQGIDSATAGYWSLVYADTTLTTQLDGEREPHPASGPVTGTSTSSSTQPGLMAVMLHALQLTGDERVLEIGTGTGYNAALLSHYLGADQVTSVEVDPTVADHARSRLAALGYQPAVATGDGEQGWADGAPYDRIIATCSVPRVPRRWVDQVRDGGIIVTSLWRDLGGGPLIKLNVNDGVAQGRFLPDPGGFMPVRSVSTAPAALATAIKQSGTTRDAKVPSTVLHHPHVGLWIALQVQDVTWVGFTPDGGQEQVWLFAADGSWAMIENSTMQVEQHGRRSLWDEIELVHKRWQDAGAPHRERLGLTVTEGGRHRFWLDTPDETHRADNSHPHL